MRKPMRYATPCEKRVRNGPQTGLEGPNFTFQKRDGHLNALN